MARNPKSKQCAGEGKAICEFELAKRPSMVCFDIVFLRPLTCFWLCIDEVQPSPVLSSQGIARQLPFLLPSLVLNGLPAFGLIQAVMSDPSDRPKWSQID